MLEALKSAPHLNDKVMHAANNFVPNASSGTDELIHGKQIPVPNVHCTQRRIQYFVLTPRPLLPPPAEDVNVEAPTKIPTETLPVDAMTPAPTPAEDENVAAATETPTETPTVDALTPAPTPMPGDDTTVVTTSTRSTLAPEVGDPCIICPNGITAGDDFVPNASSGNSMTCLDGLMTNSSMDYKSGSQMCSFSSLHKNSCCPTTTTPNPAKEVNDAAPTKTPTLTSTVDAMTPVPTPAPTDDTTVATTTTTSTLGSGTEVDNPVPLLVMIMSHMKGVLQHVQVSLRVPNDLNLGPMSVDCMT